MKLDDAARELIGSGADATLVTINPDGSPQVSVVWVAHATLPVLASSAISRPSMVPT